MRESGIWLIIWPALQHGTTIRFLFPIDKEANLTQTICVATGKVRHPDRSGARLHNRGLLSQQHSAGDVYRCRLCGDWHIGHDNGKINGRKRRGLPFWRDKK